MSKKVDCSFSVIGPRVPEPIFWSFTSRMGVTSAAVPVKNSSSAVKSSSGWMVFLSILWPRSFAISMMLVAVMPSRASSVIGGV